MLTLFLSLFFLLIFCQSHEKNLYSFLSHSLSLFTPFSTLEYLDDFFTHSLGFYHSFPPWKSLTFTCLFTDVWKYWFISSPFSKAFSKPFLIVFQPWKGWYLFDFSHHPDRLFLHGKSVFLSAFSTLEQLDYFTLEKFIFLYHLSPWKCLNFCSHFSTHCKKLKCYHGEKSYHIYTFLQTFHTLPQPWKAWWFSDDFHQLLEIWKGLWKFNNSHLIVCLFTLQKGIFCSTFSTQQYVDLESAFSLPFSNCKKAYKILIIIILF